MSSQTQYYTLVSSLPYLPHFSKAERLPINQERLRARLSMLTEEDKLVIERASEFLSWQRQPMSRTDEEVVHYYEKFMEETRDEALADLVEFIISQRTVLAALRRKVKGETLPKGKWGAGKWVKFIEANWSQPDFKLGEILPWVPTIRQHLEKGETFELERYLIEKGWQYIDYFAAGREFSLVAILVYLFKWDMLERWLSYDSDVARERFEELFMDACSGSFQ